MRRIICLFACLLVMACGDPMADAPLFSEADVATDAPKLGAIPDVESAPDVEGQSEGGFLSRIFGSGGDLREDEPESLDADGSTKKENLKPGKTVADVSPDIFVPYGRVVKICDVSKRAMGQPIAQYPERSPKHRLYDTDPGNGGPHGFYLTGFDDGCARKFTASLALFGTASMHEQLRYGLPAEIQPYSDTDKAYEKVKSRVCHVPKRKPCGAKVRLIEKSTVFLSIYENFGSNSNWINLLLHDGQVVAQDNKGG